MAEEAIRDEFLDIFSGDLGCWGTEEPPCEKFIEMEDGMEVEKSFHGESNTGGVRIPLDWTIEYGISDTRDNKRRIIIEISL